MAKKERGLQVFTDFYGEIYKESWSQLFASLKENDQKIVRGNSFAECNLSGETIFYDDCFLSLASGYDKEDASGIACFYEMDLASVIAARALKPRPGQRVLDMCAAPGGKTLVLWQAMENQGELISNEFSEKRRNRLKIVLRSHIPREQREGLFLKGHDGAKIGLKYPETFDAILVDAPCSGERHLLNTPSEINEWTPQRTKRLAKRQYGLMTSALLAARPGASILYSTCSISPLENDGVIARLLDKKGADLEVLRLDEDPFSRETEFGRQILPGEKYSFGPLYWSLLRKRG